MLLEKGADVNVKDNAKGNDDSRGLLSYLNLVQVRVPLDRFTALVRASRR